MDRAAEIAAVRAHAREVLDAKHAAREVTLGACRRTIQSCAAAIRAVQREEFPLAEELIADAESHLERAAAPGAGGRRGGGSPGRPPRRVPPRREEGVRGGPPHPRVRPWRRVARTRGDR